MRVGRQPLNAKTEGWASPAPVPLTAPLPVAALPLANLPPSDNFGGSGGGREGGGRRGGDGAAVGRRRVASLRSLARGLRWGRHSLLPALLRLA